MAEWLNPEIIALLTEVEPATARSVYDRLSHHSFMERHPYGLKFHDTIRQLLVTRLRFTNATLHEELEARLDSLAARKAGLAGGDEHGARRASIQVGAVVIDCNDLRAMMAFWQEALHDVPREPPSGSGSRKGSPGCWIPMLASGSAKCWGWNASGQLGDGP